LLRRAYSLSVELRIHSTSSSSNSVALMAVRFSDNIDTMLSCQIFIRFKH
jgi:hypothetical protein